MIAVSSGCVIAPPAIPAAGRGAPADAARERVRASLSGRIGRITPASASVLHVEGDVGERPERADGICGRSRRRAGRASNVRREAYRPGCHAQAPGPRRAARPRCRRCPRRGRSQPMPSLVVALTLTGRRERLAEVALHLGPVRASRGCSQITRRVDVETGPGSCRATVRSRSSESASRQRSSSVGKERAEVAERRRRRAARRSRRG